MEGCFMVAVSLFDLSLQEKAAVLTRSTNFFASLSAVSLFSIICLSFQVGLGAVASGLLDYHYDH